MFYWFLVLISLLIWGAQFRLRSLLVRWIKKIYIFAVLICFGYSAVLTYLQYEIWQDHPLMKNILPPFSGWSYFIQYSFFRFWVTYIIAFAASLIFLWAADYLNKKREGIFFEKEELYIGAIAIMTVGYPGIIFYVISLVFVFLFVLFLLSLLKGKNYRISLYYLWLPVSVCVIMLSVHLFSNWEVWGYLKF